MLDKGTASVPESFEGLLGDGGVGTFLAFLDSLVTAYGRFLPVGDVSSGSTAALLGRLLSARSSHLGSTKAGAIQNYP